MTLGMGALVKPVEPRDRVEEWQSLLPPAITAAPSRLLLFARNGSTPELIAAADDRDDLELVDLDRLYGGV